MPNFLKGQLIIQFDTNGERSRGTDPGKRLNREGRGDDYEQNEDD
jgi:hypothetical protein